MKLDQLISSYSSETPDIIRKPFIIAEAGVNHEGSLDIAKKLIDDAKDAGANAIKFQSYKAEKLASKQSPAYWDLSKESSTSQFKLFKKYDSFGIKEFEILKSYCDDAQIEFLSTPFDIDSAKYLNDLMGVYKISSSDLNNLPFIEIICGFNKPILLSTGASYLWEIKRSFDLIKSFHIPLCLLHCILNYPTKIENANLGMIIELKREFPNAILGYSDHTTPDNFKTLLTAILLGARIIEKHFTHDKSLPGNDHYHAMDKNDLSAFLLEIDQLFDIIGSYENEPISSEAISRKNARRSLVASKKIFKGEKIVSSHLTWKRPHSGIDPADYIKVIGKIAAQNIDEDVVLQWDMLADS